MESSGLSPVAPVRPIAPYLGGKKNLAKRIVAILDRVPHASYAEPFVGMGGIFLRRNFRPKAEAINDINGELVNLFRLLQRHYTFLLDMLRFQITSRADFDRLLRTDPTTLSDLERAARFLYLQRTSFGGKVAGQSFGISPKQPARFDLTKLEPMLADVHERLAAVVIEQLPYARFIERYDHAGALFFLDPPYHHCETDYGEGVFAVEDFRRIAEIMSALQGRFVMSINDTPEIRRIYAAFRQIEVMTSYTVGGAGRAKAAAELLITNLSDDYLPSNAAES